MGKGKEKSGIPYIKSNYCKSRIFRMHVIFVYFRMWRLPYENKMHAKGTKQVRESAVVSDCTKISCVRKLREARMRKLSAYEIFWIYSIDLTLVNNLPVCMLVKFSPCISPFSSLGLKALVIV